jgi:hypothetical protein
MLKVVVPKIAGVWIVPEDCAPEKSVPFGPEIVM